ncbi:MAG TPA: metal-dependent hydrolase [Thermoguttaceae bacterium]|nr:metal-dependent hydrolase [Thermoguttaceae bacterium]
MADFRTHITASSVLGVAYGGAAHAFFDVPLSTSVLAGGLCAVSGMLPDVDSNSGRPLHEGLAFAAAVVPMMMVDRFQQLGWTPESIVLAGAALYVLVRFALGELLKRYTVHRGMFHSLPAAVIFGEMAFLLTSGTDLRLRVYKAGAVVVGYVTHLVLDELYSIDWHRGRLRLKKSFGTALKMFSHKWWPNVSAYLKLGVLTYIVLCEPGWMDQVRRHQPLDWAQNWVQEKTQNAPRNPAREAAETAADDGNRAPLGELLPGLHRDSRDDQPREPPRDPVEPRTAEGGFRFLR